MATGARSRARAVVVIGTCPKIPTIASIVKRRPTLALVPVSRSTSSGSPR